MSTPMSRIRGFTLIEMMMALAIAAIVLATAMPAFGKLIQSTQSQTARSAVTAALDTARILAVSRTLHVVICPSADQRYCGHTMEWQHGWLIFVDTDHDGTRDDSEDVLSVSQALPAGVAVVTSAGRTRVDYRPDGSAPGSNVTFTICDGRGSEDATSLVINNAGRVRTGVPTLKAATACEQVLATPST